MLTGLLWLLATLPGFAVVGHGLSRARRQEWARLDRRIAARVAPPAAATRAPTRRIAVPRRLAPILAQAGVDPTPRLVGALLGLLVTGFALALAFADAFAALLVNGTAIGLAFTYLHARARRRRDALVEALPFYLDNVCQLMTIGHSLPQALQRALALAGAPVQTMLAPAARRIDLGAPVGDALQQLADRLAIAELSMLAAAVRMNIRFGGPMATILGNLSRILRERARIKRELNAATAETRVSTQLMVALSLLLIAFLLSSNRGYRDFFFHDPRGLRMAAIAALLQGAGVVLMLRMKRIAF